MNTAEAQFLQARIFVATDESGVPISVTTGRPIGWNNPAARLTYDQARGCGGSVSMVLEDGRIAVDCADAPDLLTRCRAAGAASCGTVVIGRAVRREARDRHGARVQAEKPVPVDLDALSGDPAADITTVLEQWAMPAGTGHRQPTAPICELASRSQRERRYRQDTNIIKNRISD